MFLAVLKVKYWFAFTSMMSRLKNIVFFASLFYFSLFLQRLFLFYLSIQINDSFAFDIKYHLVGYLIVNGFK